MINTNTLNLGVDEQRAIAEAVLGAEITAEGYAPCPGRGCHTTGDGSRDFRLFFEAGVMPHEHCFHSSCQTAREEFMRALFSALRKAEKDKGAGRPATWRPAVVKPSPAMAPKAPAFDSGLLKQVASKCSREWSLDMLREVSPVRIPALPDTWPQLLLDKLFLPGENLLIFLEPRSQGQFIYAVGRGLYKLSSQPGVKAEAVPWERLPRVSTLGAWWLCSPVLGSWLPNPNNIDQRTGEQRLGRRHEACCTAHPYAVLESDTVAPEEWLKVLVQLREKIVAVYSSGGKSIHALVRVDARTKQEFNQHRARLLRLAAVGADPAAMSAVRLTRLPGVIRAEKAAPHNMQTLYYLNPAATGSPINNL